MKEKLGQSVRRWKEPLDSLVLKGRAHYDLLRLQIDERIPLNQITWIPSLLRPNRAYKFQWSGLGLIVITAVLGIVAIHTSTGLLYLMMGLLLGLWMVSGLISFINLSGITVSRDVSRTSQVGEQLCLTYVLKNNKRFFSSYSLVLEELGRLPMILPFGYAMRIGPGEEKRVVIRIVCRRRGHMRLRRIRVSSRFPFGLIAKCLVQHEASDIVIHPSIGRIRFDMFNVRNSSASGTMGQYNQQTKGFEEYYGIREFQNFDNRHWIHWRSSARRGKLMVKEMAEYHSNQITVLLDTRVEDPLSLEQQDFLERAISFAATLIDRATERSLPVALVVSGGDMKVVRHGRGAGHRWRLMTELASVRMGRWGGKLPNVGAFRPRSFSDAHYWVIGVGISQHQDEIGGSSQNMTIIDCLSERFDDMFTPATHSFSTVTPSGAGST